MWLKFVVVLKLNCRLGLGVVREQNVSKIIAQNVIPEVF